MRRPAALEDLPQEGSNLSAALTTWGWSDATAFLVLEVKIEKRLTTIEQIIIAKGSVPGFERARDNTRSRPERLVSADVLASPGLGMANFASWVPEEDGRGGILGSPP